LFVLFVTSVNSTFTLLLYRTLTCCRMGIVLYLYCIKMYCIVYSRDASHCLFGLREPCKLFASFQIARRRQKRSPSPFCCVL
jgi:hypothetical protein